MHDEFANERLGDLPNAGYSSRKQKTTSDLVMFWLRAIERDRETLLSIVIDGHEKWRRVAGKAWGLSSGGRAGALSTELLDRVFEYMVRLAGPNPAHQLITLMAHRVETQTRDPLQRKHLCQQLRATLADIKKYGTR